MTRGKAMRAARNKAGVSIEELAARAGVEKVTVGRLEREEHIGRLDTIELLADALGLSIDEYIGHEVRSNG